MAPKLAAHGIYPDTWTAPGKWGAFPSPADRQFDADRLFETLDGRGLTTPHGAWFIEIQSIYDEGSDRWIQLTLTGHPTYTLTFRLNLGDDSDEAVRALTMWLTTTRPQEVM